MQVVIISTHLCVIPTYHYNVVITNVIRNVYLICILTYCRQLSKPSLLDVYKNSKYDKTF